MPGNRRFLALAFLPSFAVAAAMLPFDFSNAPEGRVYAVIPLPAAPADAAGILLSFDAPVPSGPVRAVSVHLHSGDGWLSADLPVENAHGDVRLPFASFGSPEGTPGPAEKADIARVSLWARAPSGTGAVTVSAAFVTRAPVAILRTGSDNLSTLCSDRCARILDRLGVPHDILSAPGSLDGVRVLVLPHSRNLPSETVSALRDFTRNGGALIVFYSASHTLARAVGLPAGTWEGSDTGWRSMALSDTGRRIPHNTENLICPPPSPSGKVLATWVDASGAATDKPAAVLGPHGAWFAHIPPRAFPAACDLFATILRSFGVDIPPQAGGARGAAPSFSAGIPPQAGGSGGAAPPVVVENGQGARGEASPRPLSTLPAGFLRGAWASAPTPVPGLDTLFASEMPSTPDADSPAVHFWYQCLHNEDDTWLDPANPSVRRRVVRAALSALKRGAAGIHLDYIRTSSGVEATPERTQAVTELVREVSKAVREKFPEAVVSAAVFPSPSEAASVNQDWPAWIREGLVDFVTPMIYNDDPDLFRIRLEACLAVAPASALVPGIGTGADESQTDLPAVREELAATVSAGCRGVSFFKLDDALLDMLPLL